MAHRTRLKYTEEMQSYIWDRYQLGDSVKSIGRFFDRPSSSIHKQLARTGGIRPRERKRSSKVLSIAEREEISRGLVSGLSFGAIAAQLDRARSTVSREVKRNGGRHSYRATSADQNAWDKSERPKVCKLVQNRPLCRKVEVKLRRKWSPEQIAGWLKIEYPGDEWNQVSHETIYRSLFIQARGAFKKELQACLRSKRSIRRAKTSTLKDDGLGGMPNAVTISQRPASVEDRAVPGHWEGDLIEGLRILANLIIHSGAS
jgi:IS30 family transposase